MGRVERISVIVKKYVFLWSNTVIYEIETNFWLKMISSFEP